MAHHRIVKWTEGQTPKIIRPQVDRQEMVRNLYDRINWGTLAEVSAEVLTKELAEEGGQNYLKNVSNTSVICENKSSNNSNVVLLLIWKAVIC